MYFQEVILALQDFWAKRGCLIVQPYNSEVGAGTFNPATFLRALGPEPWNVAYVEPSRRPTDGRYGDNPNRTQQFHQFQVILKPSPLDIQDLYLESLLALGTKPEDHDVRFVEDDWESPTLGAWGLGWQVWLDGLEISQFTYFQQVGGIDCRPVSGELTYGLERICMYLQDVESILGHAVGARASVRRDRASAPSGSGRRTTSSRPTRRRTSRRSTRPRRSASACSRWAATDPMKKLVLPAYDFVVKGAHAFNVLDARGAIGVTERARFIGRVRGMAKGVAEAWLAQREAMGFPLLKTRAAAAVTTRTLALVRVAASLHAAACGGIHARRALPGARGRLPGEVYPGPAGIPVDDLGAVQVDCPPAARRVRAALLENAVCRRGGDVVWGTADNALNASTLVGPRRALEARHPGAARARVRRAGLRRLPAGADREHRPGHRALQRGRLARRLPARARGSGVPARRRRPLAGRRPDARGHVQRPKQRMHGRAAHTK